MTLIDLEKMGYQMLAEAAGQSNWIPDEYLANDWLADCAHFLRAGEGIDRHAAIAAAAFGRDVKQARGEARQSGAKRIAQPSGEPQ